ncbi:MAG: folate-binding protein [Pseudomonadota bacterium]
MNQTSHTATHLPDRALVQIAGPDAETFLQNLVTCDIVDLKPGQLSLGALLTPQGKVLFEFLIARDPFGNKDGFVVDLAADQSADFVKRLTFYKLRAAVTLTMINMQVGVALTDTLGAGSYAMTDPRHASLGQRVWGNATAFGPKTDTYDSARVAAGVPELGKDFAPQSAFPHDVLMDQYGTGGVDFSKGCYVGQEVVSRMHHRGTARSRFVRVTGAEDLPQLGTEILAGDRAVGQMGGHVGRHGLALVRLDRVAKALRENTVVTAGGAAVTLALPDFVKFGWPEEAA